MYSLEQAQEVAARFRREHPEALNVRVETRRDGTFRAVFDHLITRGRKGSDKPQPLNRRDIAGWGLHIAPELWEALERSLTADEAQAIREAIEPHLPKRWRFREEWFADGMVWLVCAGKKTMVTSHCEF